MVHGQRQLGTWLIIVGVFSLAGGCSHEVRQLEMPIEPPEAFSVTGAEPFPNEWWRAFDDKQLNDLNGAGAYR
jgi:hypothetical protein